MSVGFFDEGDTDFFCCNEGESGFSCLLCFSSRVRPAELCLFGEVVGDEVDCILFSFIDELVGVSF